MSEISESPPASPRPPTGPRRLGRLAPLMVGAIVLAAGASAYFVFLRPARFGGRGKAPETSKKTGVAIFPFRPAPGAGQLSWYGQAVAEFLPLALEEELSLRLLTPERLHDLSGPTPPANPSAEREIARKGGAAYVLQGEVSGGPESVTLTASWVEVSSARELDRWVLEAVKPESLGRRLDDLQGRVRRALGVAAPASTEPPIASLVPIRSEPTRAYLEASALLSGGDASTSVGRLAEALTLSDFYLAQFLQAYAAAQLGDPRSAATAASSLTRLSRPLPTRVTLLAPAILALYGSGNPRSAIAPLESFLARFPEEKHPLLWLGAIEVLLTHEPERAQEHLRRSLSLDPSNQDARRLLGEATLQAGRPAEAVAILEAYLQARPEDDKSRLLLADACRRVGRMGDARRNIEEVLSRSPENAPAVALLGNLLLAAGNIEGARESYGRLVRSNQSATQAEGEVLLGRTYLLQGRFNDALRHYQTAVDRAAKSDAPNSQGRYLTLLGQVQFLLGRNDDALATFGALRSLEVEANPEISMINVLVKERDFDTARKLLDEQAERWKNKVSPALLGRLRDSLEGTIALEEKKYPEAVSRLEAALSGKDRGSPTSQALGEAYLGAGDAAKAEVVFRRVVEDPDRFANPIGYVRAIVSLAEACEKQGKKEEAAARYREALQWWGSTDWAVPEAARAREGLKRLAQ